MQHQVGGGVAQLQVELLAAPVAGNKQADGGGLAGGEGEAVCACVELSVDGLDGRRDQVFCFAVVGSEHGLAVFALVEQVDG